MSNGGEIPVRQSWRSAWALEVADFVAQAAGGQARRFAKKDIRTREDFKAVFHVQAFLTSFLCVDAAEFNPAAPAAG